MWRDIFGDPLSLTAIFYSMLPDIGFAVVAEADGETVGAAHVLNRLELVGRQKKRAAVGYIYAVMTSTEYRGRGIGGALTREAAALARERGADVICTLPADAGLYGWYHKLLGVECVLHRKPYETGCMLLEQVRKLQPGEYVQMREKMLNGKRFLRPSLKTVEFMDRFSQFFGGGLYAGKSGICTAEMDGEVCVIREMIAETPETCMSMAASVGRLLNAKKSVYFLPSREGNSYVAAQPGSIPADCVWNFTFD